MADVIPNYGLEIEGLELEHAQLTLNMQSQKYRISQMRDEETRIQTNIDATKTSLSALKSRIDKLKENSNG